MNVVEKAVCGGVRVTSRATLRFLLMATALGLALSVSSLHAATYYLAPGGNDGNPGTESQPWRTIGKANSTLRAGDKVLIKTGTYSDRIRPANSGTSDSNRITYQVFGDGDVVITDFGVESDSPSGGAIALGLRNYITVSGRAPGADISKKQIRLVPGYDVGMLGNVCGSEGSIVENIYAECPNDGQNCSRGFAFCLNYWSSNYESKYNILRNSEIIGNSSSSTNASDYTEDLITIAQKAHHNLIDNNTFEMCNHSLIYADSVVSHSNVIRNNVISNPEHTALSIWSAGDSLSSGARFLTENNILEGSGETTSPNGGAGNAFQWGADELIIRNNVIAKGGAANSSSQNTAISGLSGATGTSYGAGYKAADGRIYNNTIAKNRGAAVGVFDFGVGSVDLGRNTFVNNILYGSSSSNTGERLVEYWQGKDTGKDRYISNIFGNPGGSSNQQVINVAGSVTLGSAINTYSNPGNPEFTSWNDFVNVYSNSPGFVNYNNDNYELKVDSVAIDSGSPLTTVVSGCGTSNLTVRDARFFYAEATEFPKWMGVEMDWVAVGSSIASAKKVQIASVNDGTSKLTFSSSMNCSDGDYVWLWKDSDGTNMVAGNAPDIGAFEFASGTTGPTAPAPPTNVRVMP